jgi:hypothetical protein
VSAGGGGGGGVALGSAIPGAAQATRARGNIDVSTRIVSVVVIGTKLWAVLSSKATRSHSFKLLVWNVSRQKQRFARHSVSA